MAQLNKFVPCLWFDNQAEEAARFYTGVFKNSKIVQTTYYTEVGQDQHGRKPGTVCTVEFEIDGQRMTALNGGPIFKFSEAVSLQVMCKDQAEIDTFWAKLSEGGDIKAQQCGWLKDKFGFSWQIVSVDMPELFGDGRSDANKRAFAAMMSMKKLDIAAIKKAYEGK